MVAKICNAVVLLKEIFETVFKSQVIGHTYRFIVIEKPLNNSPKNLTKNHSTKKDEVVTKCLSIKS